MKKPLIAIVDDEADVGKALGRLLRAAGFKTVVFCSGEAFLRSLQEGQPDCLILDLHLPGLTGPDLQRHLAATAIKLPIIVITGRDEPGLSEKVLAAGAGAFLLKPVNDLELLEALRRVYLQGAA